MLRFSLVLIVLVVLSDCASIKDKYGLIKRMKRSPHDCGPPPPRPPPFGPPPPPPPPPPPFFEAGTRGRELNAAAYNKANSDSLLEYQQNGANSHLFAGGLGSEQDTPYSNGQGNQLGSYQNKGCDTCKGKNSAISNAESNSGNAVAIAVAKGK